MFQMPHDVGINVGARIFETVAHTRLGAQMNDAVEVIPRQRRIQCGGVGEVDLF